MKDSLRSSAIVIRGLKKNFGAVEALRALDFDVMEGSTTALLGGNGAGKTTTIAILLGLLLPTSGSVQVFGVDMLRHRYRELSRMNFSSPYVDLPRRLSVRENLRVYGHLYGIRDLSSRIEALAKDLDILQFLDRPSGNLSAGQKTRVTLAKALLNDPALLLLDEPTASLDPDTADWIRSYLERYRKRTGATILLASHNMAEVERLCDHVLMMRTGRIVDRGAPSALIAKYSRHTLEEVFLDIARGRCEETASEEGGAAMMEDFDPRASMRRISAIILRHLYVMRRSLPRVLELAYWPTMQMLLWGFITMFFLRHSSWVAEAAGVLISAVLLWDILFRSNLGVALTFMEEMWARNLAQIFVSPLRPYELVLAMMIMSAIRTLISVTPAALLSLPFYDVWVFSLGLPLIAFFANLLVFGWSIGLFVSALVLRFGLGAESLAWVAIFAIQPFSGVYYPIATLPVWLHWVSAILPSAYVFEGMRAVLFDGTFRGDLFAGAVGLNIVYLALTAGWFLYSFHIARVRGLLLQQGE